MKLNAKKNGSGNVTSYTINISKSEALQCKFVNENGETKELKKTIKGHKIIIEAVK